MDLVTVTLNTSVDRTLVVPHFAVGGHLKGQCVRVHAAGKGVNVSRCLARLGVPSTASGFVGARELPLFRDSLADTAATVDMVPVADDTRQNITILDPHHATDTHIREAGFHVQAHECAALRDRLASLAAPDVLFAFCGSLPPGVAADDLGSLLAVCSEGGARVVADLNGTELGVAIEAKALAIKPNVEELGDVVGRPLEGASERVLVAAASTLCDRVDTVLLTRGGDGALAIHGDRAIACNVAVERPRNTVGCGDAFLAGYLAGLCRGASLTECLRLAVGCGAANTLTDAAGDIDPAVVTELAARAQTRDLS